MLRKIAWLSILPAFAAPACRVEPGETPDDAAGPDADVDDAPTADTRDAPPETIAPGVFRVVFFSVGTGDSTLVQSPSGRAMLVDLGIPQVVDSGHEADAARHVVDEIERLTGSKRVDWYVASHFHTDHVGNFRSNGSAIGGIGFAVDALGLEVGEFLDRGRSPGGDSPTQAEYLAWVESKPNHRVIGAPGSIGVDLGNGIEVELLAAPGAGVVPDGGSENGMSLALRVRYRELEISLAGDLTGDCNASGVVDVETVVAPAMGAVEVYKVNHHGSQTSTNLAWVRALRPQVAVIPLGTNEFGYPHARTAAALGSAEVDVLDTRTSDRVLESPDGLVYTLAGTSRSARTDAQEAALPDPDIGIDERTDALCDNGRDDDRDGYTDCRDFSCSYCSSVTVCD